MKEKKICVIEGCGRPFLARNWCSKHLSRFYKHGDPNFVLYRTTCTVEGCQGKHSAHGLCARHFELKRRESGYKAKFTRKPETRFTDCKRYAKRKCLEWALTFEEYVGLIANPCSYCGGPLPETKAGLDRKDSFLGYTATNVVPCCRYCNQIKSNIFSYEEFLEFSGTELFRCVLSRLRGRSIVAAGV